MGPSGSRFGSSRFFPGLEFKEPGGLRILSLPGLQSYAEVRAQQLELVEKRARDEIPDTLLFLEHHPVVTRGRGLQKAADGGDPSSLRQMPLLGALPSTIEFCESERGGDLTYHGPGQLVIYPIWKIKDITAFLRGWENLLVSWLRELGLEAQPVQDATGVWIGSIENRKKVASIGIAVRRWVTYHGIAINLVNDLKPFSLISPCGFSPEVMTRLKDQLPLQPELQTSPESGKARAWAEAEISKRLQS